jgi:hypothetical protein
MGRQGAGGPGVDGAGQVLGEGFGLDPVFLNEEMDDGVPQKQIGPAPFREKPVAVEKLLVEKGIVGHGAVDRHELAVLEEEPGLAHAQTLSRTCRLSE